MTQGLDTNGGTHYPDRGVVAGVVPGIVGLVRGPENHLVPAGERHPLGLYDGIEALQSATLREVNEPSPRNDDLSWGILLVRHDKPVFGRDKKVDEVKQGAIFNCPLPALLAAMLHTNTLSHYVSITEKSQKVKSKYRDRSVYPSSNKTASLEKDETQTLFEVQFPGNKKTEVTNFFWSNAASEIEYGRSSAGALWVSIIEKAFVVLKAGASYETLSDANKGPSANDTVEFVTGSVHVDEPGKLSDPVLTTLLSNARTIPMIARRANPVNTFAHSYAVLGISQGKVQLYDALQQKTTQPTLAKFKQDYDFVLRP